MAKVSHQQVSFNAGEFGPELDGRVDIGKYANACSRCENFIPMIQGPARRRAGTKFVAEVKDSADRTWLARFEFNTTQAYQLEFGDQYVRFYTDNGVLESSPGTPYEVATPWVLADLTADDGTFALQMIQSGDILYICHPDYAPRKLSRTGAISWTISTLDQEGGPFDDYDPDQTVTVYASATTGSVSLIASSATFASTDVGRLFLMESKKANAITKWEVGKAITSGNRRRSDGKTYIAANSATTGSVKPTHTEGTEYDGDTGVQWTYEDANYGWCKITAYTSSTQVTATVVSQLPNQCVLVGNATTRWAFGSWGSVPGYPSHVCFFRNRLTFVRASDRKMWFSVAADYENFRDRDKSGDVTSDMGVTLTVESDQSSNSIQYVIAGDSLIIGTSGGEHVCSEMTDSDPFGPANAKIVKTSSFGSRGVQPVQVGASVLFIQRSGRKLREIAYDALQEDYASLDMSVLAPHMIPKGAYVVSIAYQKEPHSVIWAALSDGSLVAMTYNREQYTEPPFGGWHRHPIGGDGIVESLVCSPSPTNDRDDLWMIVRRTIDGNSVRYVERMMPEYEAGDDQEDAFYVDCGLTYDSTPATTISGLDHLEGEEVAILADGAKHPVKTVASGAITLDRSASVVHVGLAYTAKLATMRINAGAQDGTAQGKTKRIHRVMVRLLETLGGSIGPTEANTDEIQFRSTGMAMDAPVPLFTGDKEMIWPGGYDTDGYIWYVHEDPTPCTVIGFFPQLVTQDRG